MKGRDLTGQRFGRWVAIAPNGRYRKKLRWDCVCDCGKTASVIGCNLTNGLSRSCGCHASEVTAERNRQGATHGMGGTAIYNIWFGIISRCRDPHDKNYHDKGIRPCEFIAADPRNFLATIGERPKCDKRRHFSVDRIDNLGNYSCGKCPECVAHGWPMNIRWATQKEQMRNFSRNRMIEIEGRTQCLAAWAEETGINYGALFTRLKLGWSGHRLLSPVIE